MALGFEQAGFDVLAAIDLDPVHLAAHERNFPASEPVCADVADLDAAELVARARAGWKRRHPATSFHGEVDCLFGGPSCQGFSIIGARNPADPRNGLVAEFARLVAELRPRWFVLENVPGLVSPLYRDVLGALYERLRAAGYTVGRPWLLDAREHGVPQERRRVFLVGAREGERQPRQPEPAPTRVTVSDALDDLPPFGRFRRLRAEDRLWLDDDRLDAMRQRQSDYVRRLNGAADDPGDRSDPRGWDPRWLTSVGQTAHAPHVLERFRRLRAGQRDEVARLPRLDAAAQSPTLRAGTGRDHGSFTSARPVHHRSARVICVREAARLHGFPDWFGLHATKWHGFRQVGNAVPPPLAHAVAAVIVTAASRQPERRQGSLDLGSDDLLRMSLGEAAARYGLAPSKLPVDVRRVAPLPSARKMAA